MSEKYLFRQSLTISNTGSQKSFLPEVSHFHQFGLHSPSLSTAPANTLSPVSHPRAPASRIFSVRLCFRSLFIREGKCIRLSVCIDCFYDHLSGPGSLSQIRKCGPHEALFPVLPSLRYNHRGGLQTASAHSNSGSDTPFTVVKPDHIRLPLAVPDPVEQRRVGSKHHHVLRSSQCRSASAASARALSEWNFLRASVCAAYSPAKTATSRG